MTTAYALFGTRGFFTETGGSASLAKAPMAYFLNARTGIFSASGATPFFNARKSIPDYGEYYSWVKRWPNKTKNRPSWWVRYREGFERGSR